MSNGAKNSLDMHQNLLADGGDFVSACLSVRDVIGLPSLRNSRVVAGADGLDRPVEMTNVMEVPDILPWVKPRELLLTTAYPLRDRPEEIADLLTTLENRGVSAVCFKPGRYLEEIPASAIDEANRISLPIIHLGDGVGFDEIMHEVLSHNLDRRAELIRKTEQTMRELVDVVINDGNLDDVCQMLAERIGVAAAVTTLDGRVRCMRTHSSVSIADVGREDGAEDGDHTASDSSERSRNAVADELEVLECFDRSGRFRVEDEPSGLERLGQGGSGRRYSWGNCRIEGGDKTLGRIVAFGEGALGATDFRLVEQAAAAAALVLTREQAITAVESKYRTDFVLEVLRGHIASTDRVLSHAESLGWDLSRPINVAVAEVDSESDQTDPENKRAMQSLFADAWTKVVSQDDPAAAVVGSGDQVILLLGAADTEEITARLRSFIADVRGYGGGGRRQFSVGISKPAPDVSGLAAAYQEAMRALEVGRQLERGQGLSHYDSLGVYRLLLQVTKKEELRSFAREVLGPLAGDDKEEYEGLRITLQALLDHNLNVAETARSLFFHYNTLRYRITKLEHMVGSFTEDPNLRLSLALALQIVRLP